MNDKSARQIEREENEFYGTEDYELESRKADAEDWAMDIARQDRMFKDRDEDYDCH